MSEEARLIEKLRRIEALFARPGTEGERIAAERATLQEYFDDFTSRIIAEALNGDPRDVEERRS